MCAPCWPSHHKEGITEIEAVRTVMIKMTRNLGRISQEKTKQNISYRDKNKVEVKQGYRRMNGLEKVNRNGLEKVNKKYLFTLS